MQSLDLSARTELSLLIALCDLTRYTQHTRDSADADVAQTMEDYYQQVSTLIRARGGRVVKFMGDAALIVFPEELADEGVRALLDLKRDIEAWLDEIGWDSRLVVRVHFGSCIAGPYGDERRFDVIGGAVNTTARLPSGSYALSTQAFRRLAPETRKRFKKHTPPITYIREEDRHG